METFLNMDSFVAEIQDDLGFSVSKDGPRIRRWAYRGIADIGNYKIQKEEEDLPIRNLKADLPEGFIGIKEAKLVDSTGACTPVYYNMDDIRCCGPCSCQNRKYILSEEEGYFCLSSNARDFKYLRVVYYAPPMDKDGNPLIPIIHFEAVKAYIQWRYLQRMRSKHQAAPSRQNPVNLTELDEARKMYFAERAHARALRKAPRNFAVAKQIGERFLYRHTNTYPQLLGSHCNTFFRNCR